MDRAFIKPFLKTLYPNNHENIIQILRKSFNKSEDTRIEGKEFQYLKFIFEINEKSSGAYMSMIVVLWLGLVFMISGVVFHFFEKPIADLRESFTKRVDASPF